MFTLKRITSLFLFSIFIFGSVHIHPSHAGFFSCFRAESEDHYSTKPIDIVLDLDGTIVYSAHKGPGYSGALKALEIPYDLAPGAIEFLAAINQIPHVKISFFSAGESKRNKELLTRLMELMKERGHPTFKYRLLSKDQLTDSGKDLTRVRKELNLNWAVLVDDHDTSVRGQSENLIKLEEGLGQVKPDSETFAEVNHNLVRALGIILESLDYAKDNETTLSDALKSLNQTHHQDKKILLRGYNQMKEVNSSFRLSDLES